MATSTISYQYNESGSTATITPYAGLYYSTDMGATKLPITNNLLPIVSTLTLYYRDVTQTYCAFAVFFNGSTTVSYTALVVSGMGCAISNGDQSSGAITVVTDAVQKSEAGGDPVSITFAQPAPPSGQHVSGVTINGSATSPVSVNPGGTATLAYSYANDPTPEPVTLTFPQPEEGNNKISQVRVSVNDGALSTTSPVEIPAGGTAKVQYSYQPFDEYIGPVINQPVSITTDPWEVVITPVVENMFYAYYSTPDAKTIMNANQEYRIPTFVTNEGNYLFIGLTYGNENVNLLYAANIGNSWAVYGPGSASGHLACRVISTNPSQSTYTIGDFAESISVNVVHENTTTPEVQ